MSSSLLLICSMGFSDHTPNLHFDRITLEDGLSQSYVYSIHQCKKGFMWFGTADGLNRYDGFNFQIYRSITDDSTSLSHNSVRVIYEDRQGVIWIGTGDGLNKFNSELETFTQYQHDTSEPSSISNNYIWVMREDRAGNFWIGTDGGLNKMNRQTGHFTHFTHDPDEPGSLSSNSVRSIIEDKDGLLWIGCINGSLNKMNPATGKISRVNISLIDSPENFKVMRIFKDRHGSIWVGTWGSGLLCYNKKTDTWTQYIHNKNDHLSLSDDHIWGIHEDQQGNLWIGTFNGLNQYQHETDSFFQYHYQHDNPSSISHNIIRSINEDDSGILWFGTNGGGLSKYDPQKSQIKHYKMTPWDKNSLSNNRIKSICQDPDGNTWIGTDGGGLNRYDKDMEGIAVLKHNPDKPDSISHDSVFSLLVDHRGTLWAGTNGGGLNQMISENKFIHFNHVPEDDTSLSHDRIWALFEDSAHFLWVGTNEGLNVFDQDSSTFKRYLALPNYPESLEQQTVWCIGETSGDILWIGTSGGLHRFDKKTGLFKRYIHVKNDPNSLSQNTVISLHVGTSNALWLGTYGGGLNKFDIDTETFTHYTDKDGLANNIINGIQEDRSGVIWVSTNYGLSRFDPSQKAFKSFDIRDGLQGYEFNGGASFQSEAGELFFGGMNGFNAFSPEQITSSTYTPNILITDFQLFNKSVKPGESSCLKKAITETKEIVLTYEENIFSFEFASLHFQSPERNKYAYKLEGLENQWNHVGSRRFAFYTALSPGDYVFRVKGTNSDGLWNETGDSIAIRILPPFWLTTWFMLLFIMFVIFAITIIYRLRIGRVKANEIILQRMVLSRTAELEEKRQALLGAQSELESRVLDRTNELSEAVKNLKKEINERKDAQESLRTSEAQYRSLIQNSSEAIYVLHHGKFQLINKSFEKMFGYSWEEIKSPEFNFDNLIAPDNREMLSDRRDALKTGIINNTAYEFTALTKGKLEIEVEVSVSYLKYGDGSMASQGIVRNITEKKRALMEKQKVQKQLFQAQKMDSIGRLAGGIAHDFNNILTAISGHAELMKMHYRDDTTKAGRFAEIVYKAAGRASSLTRQLLSLARQDRPTFTSVNISEVINDALKISEKIFDKNIDISLKLKKNIRVKGDQNQLDQVFTNLLINAKDAMPDGGTIHVNITDGLKREDIAILGENKDEQQFVKISVSDNGMGMTQEVKERLFEPFYTTKSKGKGTGLGLAMAYAIIQNHHGHIEVESTIGEGSVFHIFLPSSIVNESVSQDLPTMKGGHETILVVDDEEEIRGLTKSLLETLGYTVYLAKNGREALSIYKEKHSKIDFVLLDVVMPEMAGEETYRAIKQINPFVKVLIFSGYGMDQRSSRLLKLGANGFIQKPFEINQLDLQIRDIMEQS